MPNARSSIIRQCAIVLLVTLETRLSAAIRSQTIVRHRWINCLASSVEKKHIFTDLFFSFSIQKHICPYQGMIHVVHLHVVYTLNVMSLKIIQFAHAYLVIWVHHQIVTQNV